MPIAQQVYAQIALSVQFRQPPRDLQALTDRIRGVYGKAGLLEKGMNRSEVLSLLGTPTSQLPNVLRELDPAMAYIDGQGWLMLQFGGGFHHYGLLISPISDADEDRQREHGGQTPLGAGIWYYAILRYWTSVALASPIRARCTSQH